MEDKLKEASKAYAETFRLKDQECGWFEEKQSDFEAGAQWQSKQSEVKSDAVEFAEWLTINAQPRTTSKNQWKCNKTGVIVTTEKLYKRFLNYKKTQGGNNG